MAVGRRIYILLLISVAWFSSACAVGGPVATTGAIVFTIAPMGTGTKTFTPAVDMSIATYDLSAIGPGGASFSETGLTDGTYARTDLEPGVWLVGVEASNGDGVVIASAEQEFHVVAGLVTSIDVLVRPLVGQGTLECRLVWPRGAIADPVIVSTVTASVGEPFELPFAVTGRSGAGANAVLEAGYYRLIVRLFDGEILKWGGMDDVRILAGQTTNARFDVPAELLQ